MNTLSWMIYAAELVEKLGSLGGVGLFVSCAILALAVFMAPPVCEFDTAKISVYCWRCAKVGVPVIVLFATIYLFTPSSRTVYMIAASEAGETVVTSPEAIEMMGNLKAIIKKRLTEELGK